jgi:hypothetical protein
VNGEKAQLDRELSEVLVHLPGWKLDPAYSGHTWCAVLIDGTGRAVHISITHAKGRLYISGMWPSDSDRQQYRPDKCQHITIARDRPAAKIADEIRRRFLPWYMAAYAEQAERVKSRNAARTRQQEVTVELAAILGQEATRQVQSNPTRIYAPGLTVDVNGGGETVSIELRYKSVKVAKAVLRALTKAGGLSE